MTYFVCNTFFIATAISLSSQQPIVKVWNENFLWSAPSYFCGARAAALGAAIVIDRSGYWMAVLFAFAGLPDLPHLQDLHGAHPGSAAARAAGLGSAPGNYRSAGARPSTPRIKPHRVTSAASRSTPPGWRARSGCPTTKFRA